MEPDASAVDPPSRPRTDALANGLPIAITSERRSGVTIPS